MFSCVMFLVNSDRPYNIKFHMFLLKFRSLISWCLLYIYSLEMCHHTPELWLFVQCFVVILCIYVLCALNWQLKWVFPFVKRSFGHLGHIGYFKSQFPETVFTFQASTTILEPYTGKKWQWVTTKIVQIVVWCIFLPVVAK